MEVELSMHGIGYMYSGHFTHFGYIPNQAHYHARTKSATIAATTKKEAENEFDQNPLQFVFF